MLRMARPPPEVGQAHTGELEALKKGGRRAQRRFTQEIDHDTGLRCRLEAESIADQMLECSPEALRVIKRVLRWGATYQPSRWRSCTLLADESRWAANQGSEWRPADRRR